MLDQNVSASLKLAVSQLGDHSVTSPAAKLVIIYNKMPIYEYEPIDRDCFICEGSLQFIQGIDEEPLEFCPHCGLEIKRIVSRASFKMSKGNPTTKGADRGFTTWKKSSKGVWEKVDGPGVDAIVASPEDIAAVEAEKSPPKLLDLDKSE